MMPQCTTDSIISRGVLYRFDKFRYNGAFWRFFDMFSVRPPPEVINLLYGTVRTRKQRNIIFHPGSRAFVINLVDDGFIILAIKFMAIVIYISVKRFRCI